MGIEGLDFQPVSIVFDKGLDTRTNPKNVAAAEWLQLQNVTFSDDNTPRQRDSITYMSSTHVDFNSLAVRDAQALAFDGPNAFSANASQVSIGGPVPGLAGFVRTERFSVAASQGLTDSYDCASANGFNAYVWREKLLDGTPTGLWLCVENNNSDSTPTLVNIASSVSVNPRVVAVGNSFVVCWVSMNGFAGTVPTLTGLTVVTTTTNAPPVVGSPIDLVIDANLKNAGAVIGAGPDLCAFSGTYAGLAFGAVWTTPYADGTTSVRSYFLQPNGTLLASRGFTNVMTNAAVPFAKVTAVGCCAFPNGVAAPVKCAVFATNSTAGTGGTFAAALNATAGVSTPTTKVDTYINAESPAPLSVKALGLGLCQTPVGIAWVTDNAIQYLNAATPAAPPLAIRSGELTSNLTVYRPPYNVVGTNFYATANYGAAPIGPQGPILAGKPFWTTSLSADSTSLLVPVRTLESYTQSIPTVNSNLQNAWFLLDAYTGVPVARAMVGTLGVQGPQWQYQPITTPCSSPVLTGFGLGGPAYAWTVMVPEVERLVASGGYNISPVMPSRLTLTPAYYESMPRLQLGTSAYVGSGLLTNYDGVAMTEHGFNLYPEGIGAVRTALGGGVTAGKHSIVAVYEWTDDNGQRHQSAPSAPIEVTAVASDSITVTVPTLQLTQKSNVAVVPYMTPVGSTTLFRCVKNGTAYKATYNDKSVTHVEFTIVEADGTLQGNEALYTQPAAAGSPLPNTAPPPFTTMAVHQNRIFCNAADRPNEYRYSQQLEAGTGLQWNALLGGQVDASAGAIVAMLSLDDKLIIFCTRRIYAIYGSGPDASGLSGQFSNPIPLPTDTGCVGWRSVVKMPDGIIFKSQKGWYLLGRDLSVNYIGAPVKKYDGLTVNAAVLLAAQQEVRFSCSGGTVLVYSYVGNQWSITLYGAGEYSPTDAIWYPARQAQLGYGYIHCGPNAGVNGDSQVGLPDTYGDSGISLGFPVVIMQTSFIKVAGMNGFQRVRWLYLTLTNQTQGLPVALQNSSLNVKFNDVSTTSAGDPLVVEYNVPLDLSSASTTPLGYDVNSFDVRHKLLRQKCKSVSFTLTLQQSLQYQGVLGLQSMQLQVGVKRGTNKLPATAGV